MKVSELNDCYNSYYIQVSSYILKQNNYMYSPFRYIPLAFFLSTPITSCIKYSMACICMSRVKMHNITVLMYTFAKLSVYLRI